jgi:hypothetical protein
MWHFLGLFFRFYIVFFYFQNCDSPCELEVGEVGEEMSLLTGGRVKAQETLGGDLEACTSHNCCL